MSRTCTICTHPDRGAIDTALISGEPVRAVASRYVTNGRPLGRMAVQRHKDEHLPKTLVKAQEVEDVRQALDVVAQLKAINGATMHILHEARQQRNPDIALKAIDRIERQITLQAKLLGDLDERPQISLVLSPQWIAIRAVIVEALAPYGEAKIAVAARLMALDSGQ